MMKYRDSNDEVLMVEEEFGSDNVEYDESEDMFLESEVTDYDMNMNSVQSPLDWSDF
ncbi:MAG: hypothetical protein HN475_03950 [Piscirickettsiaceae bacterium]|nr:hypothetical protein [Piscirickettsiaceae bacterium]